uniref:Uncharacterized protein n=1 Tax=Physcomitrium patens TaxID=3218 RepID=A0A2K1JZG9_PHYPA|nr:hypothetical protein PHYPA_014039 [Physcomitrium patens]
MNDQRTRRWMKMSISATASPPDGQTAFPGDGETGSEREILETPPCIFHLLRTTNNPIWQNRGVVRVIAQLQMARDWMHPSSTALRGLEAICRPRSLDLPIWCQARIAAQQQSRRREGGREGGIEGESQRHCTELPCTA